MKKIFKIFKRDLKNIIKNPAAIIIVIGLFFIPSLYAWVNIKACWNPYVNTGALPVAVVNEDTGTKFNGKNINVGNEIVEELKKNKDIGWQFVGDWQGNYGLNEGKYYALIEIPQNFSSDLTSLLSSNPIKPNIIYKANEKANAIATKITQVAENKLTEEIKSNFINTVNEEAFKYLNKFGDNIKNNKPQILELKDTLNQAENNISKISNELSSSVKQINSTKGNLNNLKNDLPAITNSINNLQSMVTGSKELVLNTKYSIQNLGNGLKNDLSQIQMTQNKYNELLNNISTVTKDNLDKEKINKTIKDMNSILDSINTSIDSAKAVLIKLNEQMHNNSIQGQIDKLASLQSVIVQEKEQLSILKSLIDNNKFAEKGQNVINKLIELNNNFSSKTTNASNNLYSNIIPSLSAFADTFAQGGDSANNVLEASKIVVPQLNGLANLGILSGDVASSQIKDANKKVEDFSKKINKLQDETKNITSKNIDSAIELLSKNPETIASFMSSPINVKTVEVYNTGIFGVALTPFYTVLGIWVGILLMAALLTTECDEFEDGEKLSFLQKHFGKMLLFLFIGVVQTLIVITGNIHILGINPENTGLLFAMALLSCIVFTIIIFTLVSLFGNIGKAIAVVIMVFQIAGAGGIYPIQTNPEIFRMLEPLWPFTYAIDGFREAIAGPVWSSTMKDIKMLCIFGIVFLILGIFKKSLNKIRIFMEEKFEEAEL
ncbi:YhgE/Pip domain-containing protein [Clostridium sp.]|uniref:YhgE/Pip domain-containing protein n=1 Tax=Clostridium sp. TaxID=1506 RepID=UPI0026DC2298|nr:YhgE/Pip domain-containing protein [Clostridium sp.]MDO5038860.1 YhgE/Pip domain-containing protein [Clostridium sp.]